MVASADESMVIADVQLLWDGMQANGGGSDQDRRQFRYVRDYRDWYRRGLTLDAHDALQRLAETLRQRLAEHHREEPSNGDGDLRPSIQDTLDAQPQLCGDGVAAVLTRVYQQRLNVLM